MSKLTPKQEAFVAEYLVDLNATQAAKRAGYSAKTARQAGAENLSKPAVADAIAKAKMARLSRVEINGDDVLARLDQIAHADIRKIFTPGGALLPPHEWPDDVAYAIAGFEVVTVSKGEGEVEHVAKIKWSDRKGYLEMLGKHTGIFEKDNSQKQTIVRIGAEDAGA